MDDNTLSVLEWDCERVSSWVSHLGLGIYSHLFTENNVAGDALVHLDQTDLGDMGIQSVGHRLRILKAVYQLIVKQNLQIEEHYIPASVLESTAAKREALVIDPTVVHSFEVRDERIGHAEYEIKRLIDYYHKLREDLLPIFRMAKESKPLPTPDLASPMNNNHPSVLHPQSQTGGPQLSPTTTAANATVSASAAATAASNASASANATGTGTANASTSNNSSAGILNGLANTSSSTITTSSTTSPPIMASSSSSANTTTTNTPSSSSNSAAAQTSSSNSTKEPIPSPGVKKIISKSSLANLPVSSSSSTRSPTTTSNNESQDSKKPQQSPQEPFKSFRVTMDDPCYKVLPAALRKYKITGDWREYALLVCYGDQERLLGLDEKPLIIFKELQDAGKKPVFMLRHMEGASRKNDHSSHHQQQHGVVVSGTPGGVL